jgi:RNA polymerase sigma-70 factor (ECF subfamily)
MEQLAVMDEKPTQRDSAAEACTGSAGGRTAALESLFLENQKRVYSVALNFFGGNEAAAKDITQQVFLKLFAQFGQFRAEAEFTTWLYRITINACLDEQRKNRRFLSFSDFFGLADFRARRAEEDKVFRREIADEVQKAVGKLKPKLRLPILLKYVEGLSYEEIAEVLECSTGTVASRLNRGHKMLAGKLGHLKNNI